MKGSKFAPSYTIGLAHETSNLPTTLLISKVPQETAQKASPTQGLVVPTASRDVQWVRHKYREESANVDGP